MLAPQFGNATHLLLSQPDHLGTQLPLLLVFLLLDRAPRRWYVPVTAGVVLAWVIIADRVALLDAVVPLVLVCGARVLWAVLRHRRSLVSQWYELSLVAASVLSFAAATLAVRLISHLHGYQVTPVMSATLAPLHTLPRRVVVAFEGILNIYGGDFFHISQNSPFGPALGGLPVGVGVALAAVHLVGVALAAWGFFRAFRYFFDPGDLVSPVLATAIAVNVGAYSVSIVAFGLFDTREILAVLPFGAVLAGRMVPGQLAGVPRRLKPALACASAAVLACYLAALGYGAAQPPVPDSMQAIIPWLEAHHLTHGLGTYAESNLTTMDSGGRVEIRDVAWLSAGDLPRHFETKFVLGRPPAQLCQLHPDQQRRPLGYGRRPESPGIHDPAQRHRGPACRTARARLPLQDVHHHGLEPQSPREPGQCPGHPARRDSLHARLRVANRRARPGVTNWWRCTSSR